LHHAGCCGNVWRFSVTEVCREWTQPDGLHFRGLCGNEFMPKTGAEGCNICMTPVAMSLCAACSEFRPAYWVTVDMKGNGLDYTDRGCGVSQYNLKFLVKNTGICKWESDEPELGCWGAGSSPLDPVNCISGGPDSRRRVVLDASSITVGGVTHLRWTVTVNWRTPGGFGFPLTLMTRQNHVRAQGSVPATTCTASVTCAYLSRSLQFGLPPDRWANPFVAFSYGGVSVIAAATVEAWYP